MPITVKKSGSKYLVKDPAGKVYGRHDTKGEAEGQRRAIEASKVRRGKKKK